MRKSFRKLYLSLALISAAAAAPVSAKWREASTNHFIIYSEQSPKDLQAFAAKLERFDKAMRVMRGFPDEPVGRANRVTVYVLENLSEVQRLYSPGAVGGGIAGFYLPRAGNSIAVTPRWSGAMNKFELNAQTVMLHEYAHHFMHQNFPGAYPLWFSEGFAEFYSTAKFEKDGGIVLGTPATHRGMSLLRGYPMTMEAMLGITSGRMDPEKYESIYGRGWLLLHYLTFERSRKGQLQDYLLRINKGERAIDAARTAFGDLGKLDKDVNAYLGRGRIDVLTFPAQLVQTGEAVIRELDPAENAVMALKMRSRRGVTPSQAKALLPQVRTAAAPFPNSEPAQTTLAEAEFDAGNFAEAEAAADRALAANPRSVDGLIYKGRAKMALAKAAKTKDEAAWKEVRRWLLAANKADPTHPEPPILYYESFAAQEVGPTGSAIAGLVRALDVAPHDSDLRMQVAHRHLLDGRSKEAKAVLGPIAYHPHGGKVAEKASAVIAKLDAAGTEEALKTWDSEEKKAEEETAQKKKS